MLPLHYRKLNFNFPFLNENFDLSSIKENKKLDPTVLNDQLLYMVKAKDLLLGSVIVLYYPKELMISHIHIDVHDVFDRANVNLIYNGEGSRVHWYKTLDNYSGKIEHNGFGYVRRYDPVKVSMIESCELTGTGLHQGGVPHNISKYFGRERWCLTLSLKTKDDEYITWDHAINLFQEFIQ